MFERLAAIQQSGCSHPAVISTFQNSQGWEAGSHPHPVWVFLKFKRGPRGQPGSVVLGATATWRAPFPGQSSNIVEQVSSHTGSILSHVSESPC